MLLRALLPFLSTLPVAFAAKSNGDMTSINSRVESGLGTSTVSITQYSSLAVIKVSIVHVTLKHWLVFRQSMPNAYIFVNKKDDSVTVQRYIVRIPNGVFTRQITIESGDVNADFSGNTYSKYYTGLKYGRTIDYDYVGYTKSGAGIFMIRCNRGGGVDLYDIYWYSMGHTDPMRYVLHGYSTLAFTNGGVPASSLFAKNTDTTWVNNLGIDGWVPTSGRGSVAAVRIKNMKSGFQYVAGLSNTNAQYWSVADSRFGYFKIKDVLPGTYTLTIYKGEREVATQSVTVTAGNALALNSITPKDSQDTAFIWRIGDWYGTPKGFLNFEDTPTKPTYMHPSDSRLNGYLWQDINNDHLIYFRLTAAQIASSATLRIGMTEGFIGGRPMVSINSWTPSLTPAQTQGGTRSLNVGTYRGNNKLLTWTVPVSAWLTSTSDWQILKLSVITGSTGSGYLSGGVSIYAIDFDSEIVLS
ncbi:polysaccharide lyase family 4 protein [Karstenula rhodostoma CBS 690.94]|uniref:rhamnogalacturonan endolyase n=1 Tax=Karstenula rhodostoma CBS 690.94 TaxID=1392251 RepID=A0A9P4PCT9_9PLEO|nr:polysaccharide lyase family 4 protein [Karstenula rhodostoma CBS 690.94]